MILRRRRAAEGPGEDGTDRDRLVHAARDGDAAALAALRADLCADDVTALAGLVGLPGGDAVQALAAARDLAAVDPGAQTGPDVDLLGRVVVLLLDAGGRSTAAVSELLDLPVPALVAARAAALQLTGDPAAPPGCRGGALVAGGARLTPEEHAAADAHLGSCRRCAAARAATAQARRRAVVPAQRSAHA